jgi:hypothetical protein
VENKLYTPNAILVIDESFFRVVVKYGKIEEEIRETGLGNSPFGIKGNCVTPNLLPAQLRLPKRCLLYIDCNLDSKNLFELAASSNIYGDFVLEDAIRTRWKVLECCIGQPFKGRLMPFRTIGQPGIDETFSDTGNIVEAIDVWE